MARKFKKRNKNRLAREPLTWRVKQILVRAARAAGVFATILFLLYVGSIVYEELLTSPYLEIKTIEVEGTVRVTKQKLIELSGIERGQNILSVGLNEAQDMVKNHPFVKEAEIKRRLPETVNMVITEREPAALVMVDELYVMDKNGELFKRYSVEDGLDLPVITGMGKRITEGEGEFQSAIEPGFRTKLLTLIGVLTEGEKFRLEDISEIRVDPTYGFSLYTLDEGVRVEMGKEGFTGKVLKLNKVLQARGGRLTGIESIDLTSERGVVVRFIGGEAKRPV
jgi:cell division protein FtsQ